ncbi:hypothetical protein GCM10009665_39670 [Kitasatospora nipponensis]|uniref:Peptidase M48-like protein n=1 Tax=Kitasatospora nipponensis TaxID=258049 RepID=A0ABN1WC61_9ACTN
MRDQHWSDRLLNAALGERPDPRHRPEGFGETPPPWARHASAATECPVPPEEQRQLERWLRWCVKEFGAPQGRVVAAPTRTFYPAGYHGSTEQIEELVRRVCTVMRVEAADLEVRYLESEPAEPRHHRSTTVGTYHREDDHPVISLDLRGREDPARLTAIIAHELAHVRLRGEGRLPAWEREEEKLTDFLTVHLGMGVFTANAAHTVTRTAHGWSALPMGDLTEKMLAGSFLGTTHHLGYLTDRQFGYALACWSHLRADPAPGWAHHLTPTLRAHLQRCLAYLHHTGRRLDD